MYDLCVIGGGAAGMCCAIEAGRRGLKVLLVEKNQKLGKKLYATGNGKCNLTNNIYDPEAHYNSSYNAYAEFLNQSLNNSYNSNKPNRQIIDFMESIGVSTIEDNNYIYPSSAQASSVVWAMIDELKNYNIEIHLNTEITSIEGKYPSFTIKAENKAFKASQVVLSCGGCSYASLGGTKSGYELSKSMGHSLIPIRPCLCGLRVAEDISELAGVRANAYIKLVDEYGQVIKASEGELQLTKNGLSGICIFELSSQAGKLLNKRQKISIAISLLDAINPTTYQQLIDKINSDNYGQRTVIGLFNGYVNDKLASYACKLAGINTKDKANATLKDDLLKVAEALNNMTFNITGLYDLEQAQLSAGGVSLDEINPDTFESKITKGLYITGELLDIDGICGGYNLTFAILSGIKAGKSVYDKNKSN